MKLPDFKPEFIDLEFMGLVEHNMPCSVFFDHEKAVFDASTGVFLPSRRAMAEGWRTVKLDSWFKKFIFGLVFND
jgi:hypothetical protein